MQRASYVALAVASAVLASGVPSVRVQGGEQAPAFAASGEGRILPDSRPFGPVLEAAKESLPGPVPQLPIRKPPMPDDEAGALRDAGETATVAAASAGAPLRLARLDPAVPNVSRDKAGEAIPPSRFGILGSFEFKTETHRHAAAWADVLARIERERPLYRSCDAADCSPAMRDWRQALESWRGLSPEQQILRLNRFANHAVRYADDAKAYAARDHWASPLEFLKSSGDCEDYAIFKFVSLLELGFSNDQLRIAIVRQKRKRDLHAVVTVRLGAEVYVLDNLFDHPVGHEYVLRYMPISSFNLDSHWAHIVTNQIRAQFLNEIEAKLAGKDAVGIRAEEREGV